MKHVNAKLKYPIYIPSLGRADNQLTVKLLLANGITNFYVIVEHNEKAEYEMRLEQQHSISIGRYNVLTLPKSNYGTSSPARNYAIAHSRKNGFRKHWQLDDDITKIYAHKKGKIAHQNVIDIMHQVEELDEEHHSSITGINTSASFLSQNEKDFNFNGSLTSIYLITNDSFKFRGTMLVDMDYQLQVLRVGKTTLRCNNFAFIFKTPLKAKGGYYDIYSNDKKRMAALNEFFKNNPDVEPGIKRSSAGFLVAGNISKIWRKFKKPITDKMPKLIDSITSKHWKGMPEFKQNALKPYQKVVVNLVDHEAALKFFKLLGQPFTKKTRSIWFPEVSEDKYIDKRYSDKKKTNGKK